MPTTAQRALALADIRRTAPGLSPGQAMALTDRLVEALCVPRRRITSDDDAEREISARRAAA